MTAAPSPRRERIEVGDIAPVFVLPAADGRSFNLDDPAVAGRFTVLVFANGPEVGEAIGALDGTFPALDSSGAVRVIVASGDLDSTRNPLVLADRDRSVAVSYGLGVAGAPAVVALAPNRHVIEVRIGRDLAAALVAVDAAIAARMGVFAPRPIEEIHAPVLVVPDVLSTAECQKLIGVYRMQGNVFLEPGHGEQRRTTDYKMRIPEYGRGDRIDHWMVNPANYGWVDKRVSERVFPEIRKAFHYPVTRREHYRIGCYTGARGGDLHGHRDNTEPAVAHRRFAMSINLNTEAFKGGELVYPEFGGQRYRPPTGAAIVFSSSMLHEVLEVTEGKRFVLLAFLYGDR